MCDVALDRSVAGISTVGITADRLFASTAEAQHERELVALQVGVSVGRCHGIDACAAPCARYAGGSQHVTELFLRPRTLLGVTGLTSGYDSIAASCACPLLA
jgi:hypothetical protein